MPEDILSPAEFEQALTGVEPVSPVRQRGRQSATGLQRYTPAGEAVPFDSESGVPFLTRLSVSLATDQPTKEAILRKAFNAARVEAVDGGSQFVIRDFQDPTTGQVKDLLVDEVGASLKDLADLGSVGVELLGAYAALRGGRPTTSQIAPGMARTVAEGAIASTGGELAGGVVEAATRAGAGQPVNPLEIAQRRSAGAMLGTAFDIGTTAPILGATGLINMRRGVPTTQEAANALAARNRLAQETGVEVPFSLGQATGSERLRQSEEFIENVAFGGGPQRRQRLLQESAVRDLQDEAIKTYGGVPAVALPNKDIVGGRAVAALRGLARGAEAGNVQARTDAMTEALDQLTGAIDASTGMATRQVLANEAGQAARTFVNLKHDVMQEIEGELKADAVRLGADAPFVDTNPAKTAIQQLVNKAYAKPGGLPGELMESMPSSLKPILADVANLPPNATWDDVRRLRNSANRLINQGEILGDTDTGVLKQVSKTLTTAINDSTSRLPVGAGAAVKRANKFYAEGIEGFQVKGITDILADPTQRKLGPFAVFDQAASDPDQYFRLKDALTKPLLLDGQPASQATTMAGEQTWNVFKQAMLGELMDSSAKVGNRALLDASRLLTKLVALRPAVRDDLLGTGSDVAMRSLKRLEALDNPKLPAVEALEILRQGGDTAPARIMELAVREAELDKLYGNQVIKRFVKGEIGSESIKAGDFVDRFADVGSIADVKDTLNRLELADPGLVNLIREKKVQSLFQAAQQSPLDNEVAAKKLAKQIRNPEEQARLEAILGTPGLRRLNDFVDVLAHIQRPGDVAARTGGSMAGGHQKAKLLTLVGAISALPKQAQFYFTGLMLANPNVNRVLTGPVQPLDPTKAVRAVILSNDALRSLVNEYGHEASSMLETFANLKGASETNGQLTPTEFEQALQQP